MAWSTHMGGWVQPSHLSRAGPSPKNSSKIISKKAVIFRKYFYCILINIGLYFYTIKIQIWY
jgi:hypothetical protein